MGWHPFFQTLIMRKDWESLYVALGEFQDELEEHLPELPQSKHFNQRKKSLSRKWALLQKLANEFDSLIPGVDRIPVKAPFDSVDFAESWQMWKDYLSEQHSISMKSRMEVNSLKRLVEISGKSDKEAIRILVFAMGTGYRNFFNPKQNNQITEPTKKTSEINY